MTRAKALLPIVLVLALAGCGKASYVDSARSAVDNMRQVIRTYDDASPQSLSDTVAVCHTAYDDLTQKSGALDNPRPPRKYAREAAVLRTAYVNARMGFSDCAAAAQSLDSARLAQAIDEIHAANTAIMSARTLRP